MIKLKKVKIHGFKSVERKVEVNFSSDSTSIIFGDNGSGKTTFLKVLNALFTQNESILISEEVMKIDITYLNKEGEEKEVTISRTDDLFGKPMSAVKDENQFNESNYNWSYYNNSDLARSKSIFLGVDRGTQSQRVNVNPKILMNYLSKNYRMREIFRDLHDMHDFCSELAYYLRHRINNSNFELKTINFDSDHLFLKEINMENVEGTLLNRYRQARRNAARQVQTALFDTLAVAISEGPVKEDNEEEFGSLSELIFRNRDLIIEALDDNLEGFVA
ncbi:AAA family ATPase [Vibrio cholerae]|uniref:AAA family ATPase n=1 Tax=Vibrio cholerae TaxID=666 RepID=UPI00307FDB90